MTLIAKETDKNNECFIIMPITDPDGYENGHCKRVYEDLFKIACEKAGFVAQRADDVKQTNLIHLDILQRLVHSPIAICDLSSRNPNVLFELGLRQAFDKPTVLVQESGTQPIFDIAPLRITEYRKGLKYREVLEDQDIIATALKATMSASKSGNGVNSIVSLLSLSSPASLTDVSANDTTKMLQVIMAEMNNLRTEFRDSKIKSVYPEPKRVLQLTDVEIAIDEIKLQYNSYIDAIATGRPKKELNQLLNRFLNDIEAVFKRTLTIDDHFAMTRLKISAMNAMLDS